jgi:hypothetical protein
MRTRFTIILMLLLAPAAGLGQTLADRVPSDAQIYIGWKGSDDLGGGYAGSHLKAVMDSSQISQLFTDSIPQLVDRLTQNDPDAARQAHVVLDCAMAVLRHPTAFYFEGVQYGPNGPPMPKIALLCDAGEDTAALSQKLGQVVPPVGPSQPVRIQIAGSLLVVSTFDYAGAADSLAQSRSFRDAMAGQVSDPVAAMYIDCTALLETANSLVQQLAPPPAQQMWPQIRDALGLDALKYVAATDGFDGRNWASRMFISAPGFKGTLLASSSMRPINQELLTIIPQSVSMAGACSLDFNALFTQADGALQRINPDMSGQFHQVLQQINQTIGLDIQKDLLGAFGAQWAYYVDPTTAGAGALGFTIVNQPRNPDALLNSLTTLENFASLALRQQMGSPGGIKLTLEFRQFTSNGVTVHYLPTPLISPAWTIKDGRWYAGLYPQIVVAAMNRAPDGKSILDNPGYQAVMKELNAPSQFDSFEFQDLPQTMPQGYQAWLLMSRLYLGYGDLFGLQSPPLLLPPLDKLTAEAEPGGTVCWSDDNGIHIRSITPFPGADALGGW